MEKKNLPIKDERGFLARLAVALAPQDELVAYVSREAVRNQKILEEKKPVSIVAASRSARFLGFV